MSVKLNLDYSDEVTIKFPNGQEMTIMLADLDPATNPEILIDFSQVVPVNGFTKESQVFQGEVLRLDIPITR